MLYLKNTLGGLSRSLHDSALQTFQGPYRWLKLALYVVMFVLPGGSLGVMFFAWLDHRRNGRAAKAAAAAAAAPVSLPGNAGVIKAAAKPAAPASGAGHCHGLPAARRSAGLPGSSRQTGPANLRPICAAKTRARHPAARSRFRFRLVASCLMPLRAPLPPAHPPRRNRT